MNSSLWTIASYGQFLCVVDRFLYEYIFQFWVILCLGFYELLNLSAWLENLGYCVVVVVLSLCSLNIWYQHQTELICFVSLITLSMPPWDEPLSSVAQFLLTTFYSDRNGYTIIHISLWEYVTLTKMHYLN